MFLTTNLGKPFQDASFLTKFISKDSLFGEHNRDALEVKLFAYAV